MAMTTVWAVLGALLITVVGAACVMFFIVRPRITKRVAAGARGLSRELYGQQPIMSSPAACEGCTDPDRLSLKGVGAIALTQQALVFASGVEDQSIIIPRAAVISSTPQTSFTFLTQTVKRPQPMLVVKWRVERSGLNHEIAFTLNDPLDWVAALPPTQLPEGIATDGPAS